MSETATKWVIARHKWPSRIEYHKGGGLFTRTLSLDSAHLYRSAGVAERVLNEILLNRQPAEDGMTYSLFMVAVNYSIAGISP